MTTRAPARTAPAGAPSAPASPRSAVAKEASAKGVAARRAKAGVYDPKLHCGKKTNEKFNGGKPCTQRKGFRTDHPGVGNCWLHGGNSPTGKANAERKKAEAELADLAIPVDGNPLEVLQAAVESAHGVLLAGRRLLQSGSSEAHLKIYLEAIERAARVAKQAAEAISVDEMVRIREREADLLQEALMAGLAAAGITGGRKLELALGAVRTHLGRVPRGTELS